MLQHPYSARDVFEAVVGVLNRMQSVQSVYSDIHKFKESRKYTHLPIFDDHRGGSYDEEGEQPGGNGHKAVEGDLPRVVEEEEDGTEDDESRGASEVSVESDDSDIVPEFLATLRRDQHFSRTRTFDKVTDPRERASLDAQITKSLRAATG